MDILMPKVGLTMTEGVIAQWHKHEGDAVRRGEVLFTFETEKSTLEFESPADGVLTRILVSAGETVPCLTPVAVLGEAQDERAVLSLRRPISPRARQRAKELGLDVSMVQGSGPDGAIRERDVLRAAAQAAPSEPKATPVAQRVAQALGVDLSLVKGTGPEGKITREDVERAAQRISADVPQAAEVQPLSPIRRVTAQRLAKSAREIPQVTLFTDADATHLVAAREQIGAEIGEKVSYNTLLIAICARSLKEHPLLNASWAEGDTPGVLLHTEVNIGLAVDVERGLLVPVVKRADQLALRQLHAEVQRLVMQAQSGQLTPDAMEGGTFTITNLGMFDVDGFTPLVNPPQAAILGVGRIQRRAVALDDDRLVGRPTLTLSLSFDHRVVDGAPAARFLQRVRQLIERPFALMV